MTDLCQRCQKRPPSKGLRFCGPCAVDVRSEMEASGYLEPLQPSQETRPVDAREEIADTKFGQDDWTDGERFEELVEELGNPVG